MAWPSSRALPRNANVCFAGQAMRQIHPYCIHVGNALDARDLRRLYEAEIAAVIDLALEEKPAVLGREMIYCRFALVDGAGNSPIVLRAAVEMAQRLVE